MNCQACQMQDIWPIMQCLWRNSILFVPIFFQSELFMRLLPCESCIPDFPDLLCTIA